MKALILAGGRGTRLRPLTHTSNKHLLPVGNQPMIYRVIKDVIEAGIREIIININAGDTSIPQAISGRHWDAEIHYIEQAEPNGMMYPIKLAKDIIGDDKFILHAGDNVLSGGLSKYIREFEENDSDAHLLVTKVKNPERFGVAVVEGNKLVRTVEKPKEFVSDLAVTAVYMYNGRVFEAMENVQPIDPENKGKPEYFPPPVHQWLVDQGYKVTVTEVTGWWKDTGKPTDLLLANSLVLKKKQNFDNHGEMIDTTIEGGVEVREKTIIKSSKLTGPIAIGRGVTIENCTIGPFTSIGDGCTLKNISIENSILMENNALRDIEAPLSECLIGNNCEVTKDPDRSEISSLFIGDDSILNL